MQLITTSQVSREFPVLLQFEDSWVVHDYLRIYLKNCAQKAKKEQQKDSNIKAGEKGKARGAWTTKRLDVRDFNGALSQLIPSAHAVCYQ